jgi:Ring finger domain
MSSVNQLVNSFTDLRIEGNENMGVVLSCSDCRDGHCMTKQQFYLLEDQCCLDCGTPILPEEIALLQLRLAGNAPVPIDRQFSVRAVSVRAPSPISVTDISEEPTNVDEVVINSVECGICREPFDSSAHRLVVLPCGHMICFQCTQSSSFHESTSCFFCRKDFVKDFEPYYHIPVEMRDFNTCANRSFEGYPGYPLTCPDIIYSTEPLQALSLQSFQGQVTFQKTRIWIFSNGEALLVQLNNPNLVKVLHRWVHVSFQLMRQISTQRSLSCQASDTCRGVSNCSYNIEENTDVDDLQPPIPVPLGGYQDFVTVEFVPVRDAFIQFTSPRNVQFIQRSVQQLGAVIGRKDEWLIGHTICPGGPISNDQRISLCRNSPVVFRNAFRSGGIFYDYQKIFIKIEGGVITKHCLYNFTLKQGRTEENTDLSPTLGLHSGDSTPYIADMGLLVHEVFHSTAALPHQINESPLKTFAEVAEEYLALGYTHYVDIGSSWPYGKTLNQLAACQTSLLLYTRDTNGLPIGYTLSPYFHLTSQSVIIGIVSLSSNTDDRCNYLTLGIPSSGHASDSSVHVDPILATLNRLIVSRREEIESI